MLCWCVGIDLFVCTRNVVDSSVYYICRRFGNEMVTEW